jgi:hypothetical protein
MASAGTLSPPSAGTLAASGRGAPPPAAGTTAVTPPTAGGRGSTAGTGGRSSAGSSAAGRGGTAGGGSGGAPSAGSGGAAGMSSCTMNLACKLAASASSGDVRQDCVNRINQFRTQCACMAPLDRWTDAESCADQMAQYDSMTGTAHSGFSGKICTPGGNGQNECPGYSSETQVVGSCLQQMWSEGPPPQSPCDSACFQKYGHFINMTNTKFKKVACGFFKTSAGSLWAVQNFSP